MKLVVSHGRRPVLPVACAVAVVVLGISCLPGCGDDPKRRDGGGAAKLHEIPTLDTRAGPAAEGDALLRKARRLLEAGARREAEPVLRRVLELDPTNDRAGNLLAELLTDQQRYVEAIPLLRALLVTSPKDTRIHRLLATALRAIGDLPAADAAYRAWHAAGRDDDEALFEWGRLLYERGEFEAALKAFGRAEKRRSGRADVRSEMGLTLQALGRLEEAEAKQRDALERDPRNAAAWFRLGDVISKRADGREAEAVEAMRTSVQRDPRHIRAQIHLYRLLQIALRDGDRSVGADVQAEADRRWRAVLRLHGRAQIGPRAGAPRPTGGRRAGRAEDEQRLLGLLDANPDDLVARRAHAEWLHAAGHVDEAVVAYEVVLASFLSPSTSEDVRATAVATADPALLQQAGAACLASGGNARGAELLALAVALPECPAQTRRHLAWALLLLDRAQESAAVSAGTLELSPDDRLARLSQALAWMRMGRLDEGLQAITASRGLR